MNGQEQKFLNKIRSDLSHAVVELQTRFEERWDAHDKAAERRNEKMDEHFKEIFNWLENLPCKERGEMYRWVKRSIWGIWGVAGTAMIILIRHLLLNGR
jgi:hypothetical protein